MRILDHAPALVEPLLKTTPGLGLQVKSKADVDRRMAELVASFDVKFDLNRYPYEL